MPTLLSKFSRSDMSWCKVGLHHFISLNRIVIVHVCSVVADGVIGHHLLRDSGWVIMGWIAGDERDEGG